MILTLIEKELKSILSSPKFVSVFSVCSVLIVMSVYIGIEEYKTAMVNYETVTSQVTQQMRDETEWNSLNPQISRYPDPMQIFVSGINNDIGRQARISDYGTADLTNSSYSQNMIFAVFRSMDLMFIVQIVLSLFAILFTYDAINGEREKGTLKLSFANPVPRITYIISKVIGSWLGLVIPLLIPILLGAALILFYKIPMTAAHWKQYAFLIGLSVLYFSFFICLGVFFSSLTKNSSSSFLYLLVIWVCLVLIVPRAGVMIAGQFVKVQTASEISSQISLKYGELSDEYIEKIQKYGKEQRAGLENLEREGITSREEFQKRYEVIREEYRKKANTAEEDFSQKLAEFDAALKENWHNRKAVRQKLGFSLSRFSPASAYQLAAMDFAGTGMSLKTDYEDQLRTYSRLFNKFRADKIEASGGRGYANVFENKKPEPLDLSEIPEFSFVNPELSHVLKSTILDFGILSFYILLTIAGSFIAFIRYDVR
ncbi:MAG: ABC transporter permease subunit [Deltaproteobacteria bacterium]|nr:ABC transporter permease subunit [Deltaproteobacteria bacterium]